MEAIFHLNLDVVRLLLARKADPNIPLDVRLIIMECLPRDANTNVEHSPSP